ncbi:MAG: hypothetical protein GEV12_14275 [Micromonosporaceae bacterium]|nr:hypothetical protein [Micromonosporaceae bacterium]
MPGPAANRLSLAHQAELSALSAVVGQEVRRLAATVDTSDVDAWWRRVLDELLTLVATAFAGSRTLGSRYLRQHAALEGVTAEPVLAQWNTERAVTALRVTGPVEWKRNLARTGQPAAADRAMQSTLAGSAQRLAEAGSRETVDATVAGSDLIVGWRRVTDADPCFFCAMLASRGAVYKTAGTAGAGNPFHDHDQCTVEPLYMRETEPPEVQRLADLWREVTAGHSGKAAIREWRRWWDQNRGQVDLAQQPDRTEPAPERSAESVAPRRLTHGEAVDMMEDMLTAEPWTRDQLVAMGDYSGANYLDVNSLLRGFDPPENFEPEHLAELRKSIQDLTEGMRPLPEPILVYRRADSPAFGVEELDDLSGLVGRTLQDPGFMSTTVAPDEVGDFDAFGEVLMEITAPAGTPAAYLEPVSKTPGEFELLLAPARGYRILDVSREGDQVRMRVEVLPE